MSHGNVGNKNAAKSVKKEAFIKLMCEPEFKTLVVAMAQKHGYKNMTEFCIHGIQRLIDDLSSN